LTGEQNEYKFAAGGRDVIPEYGMTSGTRFIPSVWWFPWLAFPIYPLKISDPQARQWLEDSTAQAAEAPKIKLSARISPSNALLHNDVFKEGQGTAEWDLKELLRAYIAISMSCSY
jgi:hypothetical protein